MVNTHQLKNSCDCDINDDSLFNNDDILYDITTGHYDVFTQKKMEKISGRKLLSYK